MSDGRVEEIWIAELPGAPTMPIPEVRAVAGKGLEGDRKHRDNLPAGDADEPGRELTLIEAESLEALTADTGIELGPGESRRQIVTRGVRLNPLVGKRFLVGDVECIGVELNEPCAHLEAMTRPGVMRGLVHRGGLRADILKGGIIRPGDPIREVPDSAAAPAA